MNVLGIHFGHDAGISLVQDGLFRRHWEKERHSRIRHAIGISSADIDNALDYFGINIGDIDRVALCSTQNLPLMLDDELDVAFVPNTKFTADKLTAIVQNAAGYWNFIQNSTPDFPYHKLLSISNAPRKELIINENYFPSIEPCKDLGRLSAISPTDHTTQEDHAIDAVVTVRGRSIPGKFVSHHLCHAWYAYAESGYEPSLIVTFDGACTTNFLGGGIYFAENGRIKPIVPHAFHFGIFYNWLASKIGLGFQAAGKLMGLSAWGRPIYYEPELVGNAFDALPYFREKLSPQGAITAEIMVDHWLQKQGITDTSFDLRDCETPPLVAADLAASAQAMFTASVVKLVETAQAIARNAGFGYTTIALSGGCALNCPANSTIAGRFREKLFVPPAVNDEGLSVGAALLCSEPAPPEPHRRKGPAEIAFKGKRYDLDAATLRRLAPFERVAPADPAGYLAERIADGAIVALFEGEAEFGPRALGHRSIIASPLRLENWRRLNELKGREPWRPLAPIVLAEEFDRHFDGCPADSHYMLFNARVKGFDLPAVTHRDGSARVQVAVPEIGFVHELLEAFRALTGVGVLVNTSFNRRNEPIVETPADAIEAFAAMRLDYLYLQGVIAKT